ncbi:MAG: hypothetical protein QMC90_04280 [Dehalococcoidales bacterium]|nr:hypothetical protein [Dehalococcoidales bacterium]
MRKQETTKWKCKYRLEKRQGDINACKTPEERLAFLENIKPYESIEGKGNLMLNEGINEIWALVTGAGGTAYNNANAQIGVGNKAAPAWAANTAYALGDKVEPTTKNNCVYECTTAGTSGATEPTWTTNEGSTVADNTVVWTCHTYEANAAQTDLIGASILYKGMEAGYPTSGAQKVTFKSSFGATEANWAWEEWSVRNGATANKNLNRKVESLGTKSTGTWTLEVSITLS